MSAGKLSKIENGRTLPTVQDVDLILSALGVSDAVKEQFLATARAEVTEATAWRLLRRMGPWKHQNTIKAIEANTAALRLFQGQLVPGLLQTPEYATAVFSLPPALPDETRTRTVGARMERQATLYEDSRSFYFVICEHVLRWLICEPVVMAVQLDRLVSLSRLPRDRTRATALLTRNDRRPPSRGPSSLLILHQADAGTTVASPAPWASSWTFARCTVRSASKSSQRLTISHSTPVSGFGFSYGFPCKEIGVIGEST